MGVERERVQSFGSLAEGLRQGGSWYHWGPYLSERQWGTVRADTWPVGLDDIGPLDRSHLPAGSVLEQSDATGWTASYALAMGVIATVLRHAAASHQTGWTGLVADLIRPRHGGVTSLGDLLRALRDEKDVR